MARKSAYQEVQDLFGRVKKKAGTLTSSRVISPVPSPKKKANSSLFSTNYASNLRGNVARIKAEFGDPRSAAAYTREFGRYATGTAPITRSGRTVQSFIPRPVAKVVRPIMNAAGGFAENTARGPANVISGAIGGRPKQVASGAARSALTLLGSQKVTPAFSLVGGALGGGGWQHYKKGLLLRVLVKVLGRL